MPPPRDIDSYRQEVEQYLLTQDIIVADSTDDVDETKQCVLREEFNSVLGNLSPEDIIKEPSEWVFNVIQGTKPNVEERGKIYKN